MLYGPPCTVVPLFRGADGPYCGQIHKEGSFTGLLVHQVPSTCPWSKRLTLASIMGKAASSYQHKVKVETTSPSIYKSYLV